MFSQCRNSFWNILFPQTHQLFCALSDYIYVHCVYHTHISTSPRVNLEKNSMLRKKTGFRNVIAPQPTMSRLKIP